MKAAVTQKMKAGNDILTIWPEAFEKGSVKVDCTLGTDPETNGQAVVSARLISRNDPGHKRNLSQAELLTLKPTATISSTFQ